MADGSAAELDRGGLDEQMDRKKTRSENFPGNYGDVRIMWEEWSDRKTSPGLQRSEQGGTSMRDVSCEGGPARRDEAQEGKEGVQVVRNAVHADALDEAQLLQRQVSVRDRPHQRDEEMDPWEREPEGMRRVSTGVKNRVHRLRALGNAVVPQQAYPLFKAIADYEAR